MSGHQRNIEKQRIRSMDESKIPQVLILRGMRDRKGSLEVFRRFFHNVESLRLGGSTNQDMFLGERYGIRCALASVYGACMAEEIVYRFGSFGVTLVLHTGCCVAKTRRIQTGDLFIATEAYQDNGAGGDLPQVKRVEASYEGAELSALHAIRTTRVHWGRVYSSERDFCLEEYLPPASFIPGCWAVDRETAAVFAASKQFGIHRTAILYVSEPYTLKNPDVATHTCHRCGEEPMLEILLTILKSYSEKVQAAGLQVNTVNSNQVELSAEQKQRQRFWQAAVDSKM